MNDAPRVEILPLSPETLHALADGDLAGANRTAPVPLPEVFVAADWIGTWRYRSDQVRADPSVAGWVTGAVWDPEAGLVVGKAGFHAPPDADGRVEVGYATLPELRRRGYARAALEELLDRAAREPAVRVVRASVSPGNVASLGLVQQYGFVRVGEQWDEEDGLEVVYERPAERGPDEGLGRSR